MRRVEQGSVMPLDHLHGRSRDPGRLEDSQPTRQRIRDERRAQVVDSCRLTPLKSAIVPRSRRAAGVRAGTLPLPASPPRAPAPPRPCRARAGAASRPSMACRLPRQRDAVRGMRVRERGRGGLDRAPRAGPRRPRRTRRDDRLLLGMRVARVPHGGEVRRDVHLTIRAGVDVIGASS